MIIKISKRRLKDAFVLDKGGVAALKTDNLLISVIVTNHQHEYIYIKRLK